MRLAGWLLCAALVGLAAGPVRAEDDAPPPDFLHAALDGLELGEGVRNGQLVLFPLLAKEAPAPFPVLADRVAEGLLLEEPTHPDKRYNLRVRNVNTRPVLLLGGTVLVGGKIDRLVPTDMILPMKGELQVTTLPAAIGERAGPDDLPAFQFAGAVAPAYLRELAHRTGSPAAVRTFMTRFLSLRDPGDTRKSLAALAESKVLNAFLDAHDAALEDFPNLWEKRVVGIVSAVRGRVHAIDLFATNAMLRTYFRPLLRAHTYAAAAVELKAEKMGLEIPGNDDPQKTLEVTRKQAIELLSKLRKATWDEAPTPAGTMGAALRLATQTVRGGAIAVAGRVVHAGVFVYDPFERALYTPMPPPPRKEETQEKAAGELERRADRGTATAEERRKSERRPKPGGGGRRGPPDR